MKKFVIETNGPLKDVKVKTSSQNEVFNQNAPKFQELLEEEYKKGFEEGYKKAYMEAYETCKQELSEQIGDLIQTFEMRAQEFEYEYKLLLQNIEENMVALIISLLEQLLQERIKEKRYNIIKIIEQATCDLKKQNDLDIIEIHCSSEDNELLEGMHKKYEKLNIIIDSNIASGDCILKTNLGQVIIQLQDRVDQVKDAFSQIYQMNIDGE